MLQELKQLIKLEKKADGSGAAEAQERSRQSTYIIYSARLHALEQSESVSGLLTFAVHRTQWPKRTNQQGEAYVDSQTN